MWPAGCLGAAELQETVEMASESLSCIVLEGVLTV